MASGHQKLAPVSMIGQLPDGYWSTLVVELLSVTEGWVFTLGQTFNPSLAWKKADGDDDDVGVLKVKIKSSSDGYLVNNGQSMFYLKTVLFKIYNSFIF